MYGSWRTILSTLGSIVICEDTNLGDKSQDYVCIPVTSAPVEILFSHAGYIVSHKRFTLSKVPRSTVINDSPIINMDRELETHQILKLW